MAQAPLVPATWQLPDYFRKRLGSTVGRQRFMEHDGHLLLVMHQVPLAGETTRRGVLFWRDAAGQWQASNGDPGKVAIANLLGKYERALEGYDQQEERAQRSDEYLPLLEGLAPIVRSTRNLHNVLQEARKVFPEIQELIDVRDRAYELSRSAELLNQDARNSMEVAVVRRAEEQALTSARMEQASHRLNTLAAIFFPLATLGAIFGTTLTDNWTWSHSPLPFVLFLITGSLLGILIALFINRK
ncbi:MAG: hypothetical protein R3C53_06555 [Pirellulaceae bacterium]